MEQMLQEEGLRRGGLRARHSKSVHMGLLNFQFVAACGSPIVELSLLSFA